MNCQVDPCQALLVTDEAQSRSYEGLGRVEETMEAGQTGSIVDTPLCFHSLQFRMWQSQERTSLDLSPVLARLPDCLLQHPRPHFPLPVPERFRL